VTRDEVAAKLRAFLQQALVGNQEVTIGDDDDLRDTLGLDSMGAIEFVDQIEEEFEVEIEDDELRGLRTFNDAVDLAMRKLAERDG
jgi:acyl carrier protein